MQAERRKEKERKVAEEAESERRAEEERQRVEEGNGRKRSASEGRGVQGAAGGWNRRNGSCGQYDGGVLSSERGGGLGSRQNDATIVMD